MNRIILVNYLLGECDAKESQEIAQLIEISPEIKKQYEDLKKVWQASNYEAIPAAEIEAEMEKYLLTIDSLNQNVNKTVRLQESKKNNFLFIWKTAAVILLSIGISSLVTYLAVKDNKITYQVNNLTQQIIAPKGSNSIAILPDGTKVWLNAGTILKYSSDYGIKTRNVELEGEAYFKVVTNPAKPFTVITSELKIKAYGTAFNVKAYPDEKVITTTLEEGKVSIIGKGIEITLKPKQNIIYERQKFQSLEKDETPKKDESKSPELITREPKFNMLSDVKTEIYTAWKDGQWIIDSETLPEVAILLERKFNVTVQIESEELLKYKFRGTFTNETLEQILNVFRFTAPLAYRVDKGIVIIKLDKIRKAKYLEIIKE